MEIEKFKQDLKVLTIKAMREDKVALETYRSITNAILVEEKKGANKKVDPIDILLTAKKQRMQAIAGFLAGGNTTAAKNEEMELVIIEGLLPSSMSDTELEVALKEILANYENPTKKDMGKIMSDFKAKYSGQDMSKISKMLNSIL